MKQLIRILYISLIKLSIGSAQRVFGALGSVGSGSGSGLGSTVSSLGSDLDSG
jgi:hypothetical protein